MFVTEKLENRRLLSVSVKFDPTSGHLDVLVHGLGSPVGAETMVPEPW